jgi:hypothetical protein
MLHFVFGTPCRAFVTQQVTKPGFPHVDWAAHFLTAALHCFGRRFASARAFATAAAQLT